MVRKPKEFRREKVKGFETLPMHQGLDLWVNVILGILFCGGIIWQKCILIWRVPPIRMSDFLLRAEILATAFLEFHTTHLALHHSPAYNSFHGFFSPPGTEKSLSVFDFLCL
jgi:hypothetical protein